MMLKTREDLVKQVLGQDKQLRAAQARFQRKIRKFYADYVARFKAVVLDPSNISESGRLRMAVSAKIATELERILVEAGLEDFISDYIDEFESLQKQALSYFGSLGEDANLAGVDRDALRGFIEYSEQTIRKSVEQKLVAPLQEGLFQATLGELSRDQITQDLLSRTETLTAAQVEVLVNDSFAQHQRTVTVQKASALELEVFVYVGPDDEITSEQCEYLLHIDDHGLEGALYKDEISADLHENLRANPLIAGGHPRCRHKYMPVTLEYAQSLGFVP